MYKRNIMWNNSVWIKLWLKMRHNIDNFFQGSWNIITPEASWVLLHLIPVKYYNIKRYSKVIMI